ncbi:MAG: bifunctional DNA-formamidopyrimidine glycosylase/DNA-(apurinic or apyrimidinic site) lyase [Gammaproteobacteria bacterium]|nr:bifunctional DNA-formamidopyrimidine glycosylase/DNA-(apurinic or apyrimidinic site) lyase [Gammaproteobacteria bacterium]
MPELPEVETTRRGIAPHVTGRRVERVLVRQPSLRWPVSEHLGQSLTGQRIASVDRRGKYLLIVTAGGRMMVHLGMSGSLRVLPAGVPPEAHDHIDVALDDGRVLRYRDPRRFGSVFWLDGDNSHPLLADLGPEPLSDAFDGDFLYRAARGRKSAVKTFIMNSRIVVGVGNIYANEALFEAGILPSRQAGRIARTRYEALACAIKDVLGRAIAAGGTTLRDFVQEDGSPGYFRADLRVYGKGGLPCVRCGDPLREVRLGQRSTVYCRGCQR